MRLHSAFVSVLTAGLLVGCAASTPTIPNPFEKGFVAFESPRDFDGPGQVYRVDPKGAVYHVGEIKVEPKTGTEQSKGIRTKVNWSLATALKYTGASLGGLSPEASAQFSHERSVTIESTSVTRQYLEDTDNPEKKVTELLGTVKYRPDNKYYLIRETAATKEINVKGSRKSLGNAKVQAELKSVISGNAELKYDNESSFSLVAKFPKDMRVWYKPERLEPQMAMGAAAPGTAGAKAVPAFTRAPVKPGELSLPKKKAATKP
jgi:hypothetical protein